MRKLQCLILLAMIAFAGAARATESESFGQKVTHFFLPWTKHKKSTHASPTPSPTPSPSASPGSSATTATDLTPTPTTTPTPTPVPKATPAANATITTDEIADYDSNSDPVRKIVDVALGLTSLNLDYRYGSADPTNGGMDCSGFVYYVLTKCGVSDVPRDARDQYIWVRKAGTFEAVIAQNDETFELDALHPGDLLFWGDTHSTSRDPAITQTMIYLGREKSGNQRIMVGASDGKTYKNQPRNGVSVVDLKISPSEEKADDHSGPTFVGYARVPGFTDH